PSPEAARQQGPAVLVRSRLRRRSRRPGALPDQGTRPAPDPGRRHPDRAGLCRGQPLGGARDRQRAEPLCLAATTLELCSPATGACAPVRAPGGELTLDPAWSPDGRLLAFAEAPASAAASFFQPVVARWYAMHTLWILRSPGGAARRVPGSSGATAPVWSANANSLVLPSGRRALARPRPRRQTRPGCRAAIPGRQVAHLLRPDRLGSAVRLVSSLIDVRNPQSRASSGPVWRYE